MAVVSSGRCPRWLEKRDGSRVPYTTDDVHNQAVVRSFLPFLVIVILAAAAVFCWVTVHKKRVRQYGQRYNELPLIDRILLREVALDSLNRGHGTVVTETNIQMHQRLRRQRRRERRHNRGGEASDNDSDLEPLPLYVPPEEPLVPPPAYRPSSPPSLKAKERESVVLAEDDDHDGAPLAAADHGGANAEDDGRISRTQGPVNVASGRSASS